MMKVNTNFGCAKTAAAPQFGIERKNPGRYLTYDYVNRHTPDKKLRQKSSAEPQTKKPETNKPAANGWNA